jgi:hypothetical protein
MTVYASGQHCRPADRHCSLPSIADALWCLLSRICVFPLAVPSAIHFKKRRVADASTMGWSVEVHERQRLAEAAAARRPKRAAAAEPRPIESGVWRVSAGEQPLSIAMRSATRSLPATASSKLT